MNEKPYILVVDDMPYNLEVVELCLVDIDADLFRPAEVEYLKGSYAKAKENLNWSPEISFNSLVEEMVNSDLPSFLKFRA